MLAVVIRHPKDGLVDPSIKIWRLFVEEPVKNVF